MLYQKKIYKLVFLFLFLFYSLFVYDCYGTEEQSKCTCEIDGKSLCPRCLDDFSLYFSNRNIDQVDALDIASKPIQHKSANIESCENCEENLIKFYFMGKKTLCPRCTLEYLSFHFSSQEIDTLKLNCAEIIFDFIDNNALPKKIEFATIKTFVDEKFDKELELLKKRKNKNQRFNFFVIANEILKKLKQKSIERRECIVCSQAAFHFIKIPCCEKFMCMKCLVEYFRKNSTQKCILCESEYLCRNVQEFSKMFKSTCVAIREICFLEITKEKEEKWKNEIMKMKKVKQNGNMRMKIKKFTEIVEAHEDYALNLMKQYHLFDTENTINEKPVKKSWIDDNWSIILDFGTYFLQLMLFADSDFGNSAKWIFVNTLTGQILAAFLALPQIYTKKYRSNKVNKKHNDTSQNINKFFLPLINSLLASCFYGPKFFEHYFLIGFIFNLVPPIYLISQRVSTYIHFAEIHESFYEFY